MMSGAAEAHLRDPNVPPCFEMQNERVVARPDTSAENVITFSVPEIRPAGQTRFVTGEHLNISVQITGQLCSPYSVFVQPQAGLGQDTTLVQQTSPSPVYPPGKLDHRVAHFVTFAIDPHNFRPGAQAGLSAIRLAVVQYGSYKQLASLEIPLSALWRAPDRANLQGVPEYECADDMKLPDVIRGETPRCSSSLTPPSGASALDLNRDGICEWIVPDVRCDKTHGNRCFRILQEHNGDFRPIAQFYNKLTLHDSDSEYRGLSSLERGPLSDLTRYSEWRDGEYVTHMYLHDCSRLP